MTTAPKYRSSTIVCQSKEAMSQDSSFVLIHPPASLNYPLLGFLPWTASIAVQTVLLAASTAIVLLCYLTSLPQDLRDMVLGALTGIRTAGVDLWHALRSSCSDLKASSDGAYRGRTEARHSRRRRENPSFSSSHSEKTQAGQWYPGLVNTGNSCFFNSVLQSLASLPAFLQHLRYLQSTAEHYDVPTPVLDALLELVSSLNTSSIQHQRAIRPEALTVALAARGRESRGTLRSLVAAQQQQDAHELLVLLLDVLGHERQAVVDQISDEAEEMASKDIMSGLASLVSHEAAPSQRACANKTDYLQGDFLRHRRAISGQSNPFEAMIAQRTACLFCGYYDVIRHYRQEELSVNVPVTRWGSTGLRLDDFLAEWATLEPVEWRCWGCTLRFNITKVASDVRKLESSSPSSEAPSAAGNGVNQPGAPKMNSSALKRLKEIRKTLSALQSAQAHSMAEEDFSLDHPSIKLVVPPKTSATRSGATATKQTLFLRPPRVLAIHLNRSVYAGYGATKNDSRVAFGEYLDLRPLCLGSEGVEADPMRCMNDVQLPREDAKNGEGESKQNTRWITVGKENGVGKSHGLRSKSSGYAAGATKGETANAQLPASLMYRLSALVVHYGDHSFGHYVAYRRAPTSPQSLAHWNSMSPSDDDLWLRISDENVQPCRIADALSEGSGVFIVFYERVEKGEATKLHCQDTSDTQEVAQLQAVPSAFSSPNGNAPHTTERGICEDDSTLFRVHSALLQASQERQRTRMQGRCVERWQMKSWDTTPALGSRAL